MVTTTMSDTNANTAWNDTLLKNPHEAADKRGRVQRMFAAIAPSYDLNNRLHSFWRDQAWRRKAVALADIKPTDVVIDVACGTGDLTLAFASKRPRSAIGVDLTFPMLPIAVRKGQAGRSVGRVSFINADAQAMPLADASADVVSIAFGIRNVQSIPAALGEFRRLLRPGGRLVILEFSKPTNPLLRSLNDFYCGSIMPVTATWISGDKSGAYKYLPKSVDTFITRQRMVDMMADAGFAEITQTSMTFGVCVCYRGVAK